MEPFSFSNSLPFVPPEVLCDFRETGFLARMVSLWRAFRALLFR